MIQEIVTMIMWGLITFESLVNESISIDFAYIGMCIMLVGWLLHKEE